MKFAKITTIMLWVILGISLILIISLLSNLDANVADEGMSSWISTNLYWSYVLLGISVVASLVLEFLNTISDKSATKSALIALGFLGAVVLISYIFSDSEIPKFYGAEKFVEDGTITPTVMLWTGTGLIATYILSALSIIAIVWSNISRIFK
jgi:Zn-dependent protease with chaperone function